MNRFIAPDHFISANSIDLIMLLFRLLPTKSSINIVETAIFFLLHSAELIPQNRIFNSATNTLFIRQQHLLGNNIKKLLKKVISAEIMKDSDMYAFSA